MITTYDPWDDYHSYVYTYTSLPRIGEAYIIDYSDSDFKNLIPVKNAPQPPRPNKPKYIEACSKPKIKTYLIRNKGILKHNVMDRKNKIKNDR